MFSFYPSYQSDPEASNFSLAFEIVNEKLFGKLKKQSASKMRKILCSFSLLTRTYVLASINLELHSPHEYCSLKSSQAPSYSKYIFMFTCGYWVEHCLIDLSLFATTATQLIGSSVWYSEVPSRWL